MSVFDFLGIGAALAEATQTASSTGGTTKSGSLLGMLPMLVLFIVVFYFLLVRPQTKRAKEHRKLMTSIAEDDEVMTAGGIVGKIKKIKENYLVVEIAKGIEITVQKNSISTVLPKGTMGSMEQ